MSYDKELILSKFAEFASTANKLGWQKLLVGGYECITIYLVSQSLYDKVLVAKLESTHWDMTTVVNPILRENPDEWILVTVYNDDAALPVAPLIRVHDDN